jgi:pseudouridine 5'-phosphatase
VRFPDDISAVLFDMDGVLLDTEPLYTVAYDHVLAPFGASLDLVTKREIMGRPAAFSVQHVLTKFGVPLTVEEFLSRRKPILEALIESAPPLRGAPELIEFLKTRGVPMAVATSTDRRLFAKKTAVHPWFSLFDAVVCGDDARVLAPKPAPDIFLEAARQLGIAPKDCAILEDSPSGLRAARAAGGRVIAVAVPHEARAGTEADLFVDDLAALLSFASTASS